MCFPKPLMANAKIHVSYIVGVVCFAYLAFYAIRVTKILKAQGIELDQIKNTLKNYANTDVQTIQ